MVDATATEKERIAQEVAVVEAGPARKRLTITIPAETINERLGDSIDTLASEAILPGFRKGRAPKALLRKKFGSEIRTETRNQLIADAYAQAIEDEGIKPVGNPEPVTKVDEIELEEGKPLTVTIEVEVVAEFDLPDVKSIEVKKPSLEITDEHVENELDRQRVNFGESHRIERDFQKGDRLTGYARVTKKGEEEPFFQHEDVSVVHPGDENDGRGQVLGLLIDGLAGMIDGKKVGDTIEIETKGPEQHEREDIRGAEIVIEFQIRGAERIDPAPIEKVVENYGMPDEKVLREQIRFALEQRRDQEQASAMREQLYEQLAEMVDFDLPEKMSAAQADRMIKRAEIEMLYRGMMPEEVEERLAEIRAEAEESARRRLKLFFLMHRFGDEFEINVTEQEINGRIAQIAAQRGMRPEQLRNELAQAGRLEEVAMQIREHKTADRLIQQTKVTDISTEEWRKIVEGKQSERKKKAGSKKTKKKKKTTKKSAASGSTKKKTTKKTSKKSGASD